MTNATDTGKLAMLEFIHINEAAPDTGGWKKRHFNALLGVGGPQSNFEFAIAHMLNGWCQYAKAHEARYESGIGDDPVIGAEWIALGHALKGLLDGDCGRIDCGSLSHVICNNLRAAGVAESDLS